MIDLETLREAIAYCNQHKNEMNGIYLTADEANDILTMLEEQEKRLKDPDRIKVTRCKDCRFFEPCNAEEGDNSGHCRNDYAPCQNQTVDAWWFCGSAERVSE